MLRRLRVAVCLAVVSGLVGGTVLPAQAATPWAVTSAATGSGTYSQSFSVLPNYQWSITAPRPSSRWELFPSPSPVTPQGSTRKPTFMVT
jgi:hypothetical protein